MTAKGKAKDLVDVFKGKYVVSYGRSGLYDLYNSKDELICDGVNYKDLNNILGK